MRKQFYYSIIFISLIFLAQVVNAQEQQTNTVEVSRFARDHTIEGLFSEPASAIYFQHVGNQFGANYPIFISSQHPPSKKLQEFFGFIDPDDSNFKIQFLVSEADLKEIIEQVKSALPPSSQQRLVKWRGQMTSSPKIGTYDVGIIEREKRISQTFSLDQLVPALEVIRKISKGKYSDLYKRILKLEGSYEQK